MRYHLPLIGNVHNQTWIKINVDIMIRSLKIVLAAICKSDIRNAFLF